MEAFPKNPSEPGPIERKDPIIKLRVGSDGHVYMEFDEAYDWIALEPAHAQELAEKLKKLASECLNRMS